MGVISHALMRRTRTYILAKDSTLAIATPTARIITESITGRSLCVMGEEKVCEMYMGRMPMLNGLT